MTAAGSVGGGFEARDDSDGPGVMRAPTRGIGLGLRVTEYRGGDIAEEAGPGQHDVGAGGARRVLGGPVDVGSEGDDARGRSPFRTRADRIGVAGEVDDDDVGAGAAVAASFANSTPAPRS